MYEIVVDGSFCATHALRLPGGETEPLHGHDWRVSVCLAAETLDHTGFVADFEDVQRRLNALTGELHHTCLNDHSWLAGVNPTAENLARVVFERLSCVTPLGDALLSVTIVETPGCRARYVRP
ncbi:MAG: 6-carboxytetrahydropterin synthase [Phycisphaerae bacterium]